MAPKQTLENHKALQKMSGKLFVYVIKVYTLQRDVTAQEVAAHAATAKEVQNLQQQVQYASNLNLIVLFHFPTPPFHLLQLAQSHSTLADERSRNETLTQQVGVHLLQFLRISVTVEAVACQPIPGTDAFVGSQDIT